jgi:hypothetical protein
MSSFIESVSLRYARDFLIRASLQSKNGFAALHIPEFMSSCMEHRQREKSTRLVFALSTLQTNEVDDKNKEV